MNKSIAAIPNRLLASLPRKEYRKLLPDLSPVTLKFRDVLYEPGKPMRDVYFPSTSLVSLLTIVDGNTALEVGMVGRDGVVGSPLALDISVSSVRAIVQGGGPALRMSKARFLRALRDSPRLQRGVDRYIHALMGQVAQTAACNRFHLVGPRLAKWLLMTRDRVGSGEFEITHRFLAGMLGVRRTGVTGAAAAFRRLHLIEYSRGLITILNHRGLEAVACSCYAAGTGTGVGAFTPWRPARRRANGGVEGAGDLLRARKVRELAETAELAEVA
ncbi:MAG: Crp/Fnr family transcriptional regulator [Betaproteobacteria bacterium]